MTGRLWCLEPGALAQLRAVLEHFDPKVAAAAPPLGPAGQVSATKRGSVAVIPIHGLMLGDESMLSRFLAVFLGGSLTPALVRLVEGAGEDPNVSHVALDVASGGGDSAMVAELASAIRRVAEKKPVVAWTGTMAGSAAYWAASQASQVLAGPAAELGSIGTYAVIYDESEAAAKAGVRIRVISSAPPIKGAGVRGSEITDEQVAAWQKRIDDLTSVFVGQVAQGRRVPAETARGWADGRVHIAGTAVRLGLADCIVESLEAAIAKGGSVRRNTTVTRPTAGPLGSARVVELPRARPQSESPLLSDLRRAALEEEAEAAAGPGAEDLAAELMKRGGSDLRAFVRTAEGRELYERHVLAVRGGRGQTRAREAYALALVQAELAPMAAAFEAQGLSSSAAAAKAVTSVPALYALYRSAGSQSVEALEAGHTVRGEMVRGLLAAAQARHGLPLERALAQVLSSEGRMLGAL